MLNAARREIHEYVEGFGDLAPFGYQQPDGLLSDAAPKRMTSASKLVPDIRTAPVECGIRGGATLSFHHHLRNGDQVMNSVLAEADRMGLRNLTIAPSSIFPVHAPLVDLIRHGVITQIYTEYASGPVADAIVASLLPRPVIVQTHGGRARSIEASELQIDSAFIAALSADNYGNISGVTGPTACRPLGYAVADAQIRETRRRDHRQPCPLSCVSLRDFAGAHR